VSPDILAGVAIREPTEVACLLEVKMKSNRHSVSPRTRSASALEICRLLAIILFSTATFLCAQDFRATLEGDVSDPSGAGVANATVKATKLENNETKEAKTTAEGHYTIPYLNPGIYNIEVRANGFSTLKMENIVLRVADKLNLPSRLQIGGVADSVVVMAQQGVIESGSADRGLVFDPIKTQELPLNGRQTYMLMSLTPGVIFTQEAFGPSGFSGTRGWDVNASYKINGARAGQNLFLLNGAPISDAGGSWQFAPNVEAVQEFKVMTNTYDAQYGRFGGGVVNTIIKSGSSNWHGGVFEYFRNKVFDANYFQNNFIGTPVPKHNQHQWGGIIGGPIRKEKDFIFFSFEGWREIVGFPALSSVPPSQLRKVDPTLLGGAGGIDFGALGYKIYDPMSGHACGAANEPCSKASVWRNEFPGDILPANRINPVGLKILSYYPAPNTIGLNNNFIASGNVGRYHYDQPMARWDHVFSASDKIYTLVTFQHGSEYRDSTGFGPPAGSGDVGSERTDQNYIAAWTHVLSPTSVFDVRGSYGRFTAMFPRYTDFNLTADKLGITQVFHAPTYSKNTVPVIQVDGYTFLFGLTGAGTLLSWNTYNQWNFAPSLTTTRGRHTVHTGIEWNYVARGDASYGWSNGNFSFGQGWTQQNNGNNQSTPTAFDGSGLATLLLGAPTGGTVDWNQSAYMTRPYMGFYVGDDWRIRPRLTINVGLRYDIQIPWLERFDRVNRGFDLTNKSPDSDVILAKWASNQANWTACGGGDATKCPAGVTPATATKYAYPSPPAQLTGGYLFPGVNGQSRRLYNTDWTNIAPRVGVAWLITEKTVLRAGAGVYYISPTQLGTRSGFQQNTPYNSIAPDGMTPAACGSDPTTCSSGPYSITNPFPNGVLPPPGSSLGLLTNIGNGASFQPPNYKIPRTYQYSLGFQRELPHGILAEASYAGNYQIHIESGFDLSNISLADRLTGVADNTYLNLRVPNPFFGIVSPQTSLGSSPTISRFDLLRADPIFPGLTNSLVQDGRYRSDALQVKIEKRVLGDHSRGVLTFVLSYAFAKAFEQNHRLNNWNAQEPLIHELDNTDKPQNLSFEGVWDLPMGTGYRLFGGHRASAIAGGWRFKWIFTYLSGYPVGWPNLINSCGTWHAAVQDENHWFNNDKTCYKNFPAFTPRTLADRFGDIRSPSLRQLNVSAKKTISFSERYKFEFNAEAFNVTNTPIRPGPDTSFSSPRFGRLPESQQNFPRVIQLAAKILF